MSAMTFIGYAAALCSTIAFVPQVVKAWRTRSTRDVSFASFALIIGGGGLWMIYAWQREDWPVFGTNLIIFLLAAAMLGFKTRHG